MPDNMLDYVPDGVFTVDADWRVTFFWRQETSESQWVRRAAKWQYIAQPLL